MNRTALYTGSFDPVTNGHVDVIRHACRMVDTLVIAIGIHPGKTPLFTVEDEPRCCARWLFPSRASSKRIWRS